MTDIIYLCNHCNITTCHKLPWILIKNNWRNNVLALSRQHEVIEHWHSDPIKLREARTACGLSRYLSTRDRSQLWFAGTYIITPSNAFKMSRSTFRDILCDAVRVNKRLACYRYMSLCFFSHPAWSGTMYTGRWGWQLHNVRSCYQRRQAQ